MRDDKASRIFKLGVLSNIFTSDEMINLCDEDCQAIQSLISVLIVAIESDTELILIKTLREYISNIRKQYDELSKTVET